MRNVHSLAYKNFMEKNENIKFYNASLKTVLDIYPIIDYERYTSKNELVFLGEKLQHAKEYWDKLYQEDPLDWDKPHQFILKGDTNG